MIQLLLKLLRGIPVTWRNALIPPRVRRYLKNRIRASEVRSWIARGCPVPPPHPIKVDAVLEYRGRFGLRTLVETGTYMGDMLEAVQDDFDRLYSIELDPTLFERARRRFAKTPHVTLIQGDSSCEIAALLERNEQPILFWLDAHYSGDGTARGAQDSPIMQEVRAILAGRAGRDVILIDDARRFRGSGGYPTLAEFEAFVAGYAQVEIAVRDDVIRISPVGPR